MKVMDKIELIVQLKERMSEVRYTDQTLYNQLQNLLNQILVSSKTIKSI